MSERTVSTAQRGRMLASTIGKPVLFAVLMWLASAAGEISIVTALLRGKARLDSAPHAALTAVRYFGASLAGNLVVLYLFGITIQSMVMHVPFTTVAIASMGFVIGDVIKAVVASLAATGLAKLF